MGGWGIAGCHVPRLRGHAGNTDQHAHENAGHGTGKFRRTLRLTMLMARRGGDHLLVLRRYVEFPGGHGVPTTCATGSV